MKLLFLFRLYYFKLYFTFVLLLTALQSCNTEEINNNSTINNAVYETKGPNIVLKNQAVFYKGVNALQTYGLGDAERMDQWNIKIVREFIGNLREQPINGNPIQASDAVWYHSLENIVAQNRAHQKITILCPFGWVNEDGQRTLLTGLNPLEQSFYPAYKAKMQRIAAHFRDQSDVWIEVWNEPFHWNNQNNYSHDLWLSSMEDMVDNLRDRGFNNIILVPGNEQGQSEAALIAKAQDLMVNRPNLLFDLHAYEKWLINQSETDIRQRIQALRNQNIPLVFGEVGVHNVSDIMPVLPFLNATQSAEVSVMAWLWNQNSSDRNALLNDDGQPNATEENNRWGEVYKHFLTQ